MGVTCRVVGFRTGVRNFVGAGFDLGLLYGSFSSWYFGVFWSVTLWYVQSQGVIVISFSLVIPFIVFLLFFGSVEPQGVC